VRRLRRRFVEAGPQAALSPDRTGKRLDRRKREGDLCRPGRGWSSVRITSMAATGRHACSWPASRWPGGGTSPPPSTAAAWGGRASSAPCSTNAIVMPSGSCWAWTSSTRTSKPGSLAGPWAWVPAAPDRARGARWRNIAEIEPSALRRQGLARRLAQHDTLRRKVEQGEHPRNATATKVDRQLATAQARVKLRSLYPSHHG
jgi:hypothetical protein